MEGKDEKNRLVTELCIPISAYTELRVLFLRNFHVFQQVHEKEQPGGVKSSTDIGTPGSDSFRVSPRSLLNLFEKIVARRLLLHWPRLNDR
jgi:hypothetical protein